MPRARCRCPAGGRRADHRRPAAIYPFFCGYTRSLVDQAAKGDFDFSTPSCSAITACRCSSAADMIRRRIPRPAGRLLPVDPVAARPLVAGERDAASCAAWSRARRDARRHDHRGRAACQHRAVQREPPAHPQALRRSAARARCSLSASDRCKHIVKSSMVMDKADAQRAAARDDRTVAGHRAKRTAARAAAVSVRPPVPGAQAGGAGHDRADAARSSSTTICTTAGATSRPTWKSTATRSRRSPRWYLDRNFAAPCPTRHRSGHRLGRLAAERGEAPAGRRA